ncbi:hypothetical protein SSPIM334S_06879 [Streptomyces spiroverticillatus]|nr:hypothetical protein [Streptomyces finlayi]
MTTPQTPEAEAVLALVRRFRGELGEALRGIDDLILRDQAARSAHDELGEAVTDVRQVRHETVAALKEGRTMAEVATMLGLSVPRVQQLLKAK